MGAWVRLLLPAWQAAGPQPHGEADTQLPIHIPNLNFLNLGPPYPGPMVQMPVRGRRKQFCMLPFPLPSRSLMGKQQHNETTPLSAIIPPLSQIPFQHPPVI